MIKGHVTSFRTNDGRDWFWYHNVQQLYELLDSQELVEHDHLEEDGGWVDEREVVEYPEAVGSNELVV